MLGVSNAGAMVLFPLKCDLTERDKNRERERETETDMQKNYESEIRYIHREELGPFMAAQRRPAPLLRFWSSQLE